MRGVTLGKGGFGAVYLCQHSNTGRKEARWYEMCDRVSTWLAWCTVHSYTFGWTIKRACEGSARFKAPNMPWSRCQRPLLRKCAAENAQPYRNQVNWVWPFQNQSFKAKVEKRVCAEREILSMPGPSESDWNPITNQTQLDLHERTIFEVRSVWWYWLISM